MNERKQVDAIIVGQGLAGTLTAHFLLKQHKTVVVMDEQKSITSTKIAAGMFTPISGKRMVKSKMMDTLLSFAVQTYQELENDLGIHMLHDQPIYNVFGSVKEQNDLSIKSDQPDFMQHINLTPVYQEHIHQPYGAFEINGSGWVNLKLLLESFKNKLIENKQFISSRMDYDQLKQENDRWLYQYWSGKSVFFCEGSQGIHNPYFTNLPFQLCKGDVLTIQCKGLNKNRIFKKGIYLTHLYDDIYKVGSTYEWNDLSEIPQQAGLDTLTQKLDELLELPYTVISHEVAIRPTTRTREAIIRQHPDHKNMFIVNGLGTKGVLSPWDIAQFVKSLE